MKGGLRDYYGRDEKIKSILSDCIIIGTVTKIDLDSGRVPYHTIAHVSVTEYLRNDYKLEDNEVLVMIQSGPEGRGSIVRVYQEDQLAIGEHVLLFLSASALLLDNCHNNPVYYRKLVEDGQIRFEILGRGNGKYIIKDNIVSGYGRSRNFQSVIREVKDAVRLVP